MNAGAREPFTTVWIGLAGITLLILVSLAMATWDSGNRYRTENIESTVDKGADQTDRFD